VSRLPLSVITGFLGSGKTTLIRRLLASPQLARSAVIVNEFGDIGLDHELIEASEEDLVELSTGCLCCAMRGDLAAAVERLFTRRAGGAAFDRILLETTGLADPAPIVQSLLADAGLRGRVTLERVIVTVDALTGDATLDAHDVSRKQAALADLLLITKSDLAPAGVPGLAQRLHALNPEAGIVHSVLGDVAPETLFHARGAQPIPIPPADSAEAHRHAHAHDDISSVSIEREQPLHAVSLTLFLQALAEICGPDLLRVKGIVALLEHTDGPAIVHGVQHVFHPLAWLDGWPAGPRRTRLVLIGRRLRRGWVEAMLATIEDEVRAATRQ
jgi:G3E family GTPase